MRPPKTIFSKAIAALLLSSVSCIVSAEGVDPAVIDARRHMLDSDINSFTFHNMNELYNTRLVGRSGDVWKLPQHDHALTFTYEYGGDTFKAEEAFERTYTNAILIMKDGKLVYEKYRNRTTPQTHFMSWSMAKSITALVVGVAVEEGKIKDIDEPVINYLPELSKGAYKDVTIRQILEMRSGVDYEERYDFDNPGIAAQNHEQALVQNKVRFADVAVGIGRAHKPGEVFAYKTIDTAVLGWLVERVTDRPIAHYMAEHIWEPLGMEANGFWIMDGEPGAGREFTGAGYNAVLRDYARLGQMILQKGAGNGTRVLSEEWIDMATIPAHPEGPIGGYGFQFWTVPNSNAFYALGLQGQYIYIDPDTKTVVVKASYFPPSEDTEPYAETQAFMSAVSAWLPAE